MSKSYVYMLSGKSQAGKDTLYTLCKDTIGWSQVSFAEKLKDTVSDLYGFTYDQMHGFSKDTEDSRYPNLVDSQKLKMSTNLGQVEINNPDYRSFFTPRRILQLFGQQQRSIDPDIWARYVFKTTIPRLKAEGTTKFVVTDTRFKNEIKAAEKYLDKDIVLIKIRIIRPNVFAKSGANDISEVDLDDYANWDYTLVNDGTLESFKQKGLEMIREVETKDDCGAWEKHDKAIENR